MSRTELLETGELQPINVICLRRLGKRISAATIWRWVRTGVRGGVKLAAVYACGCWCTTESAFGEFLHQQTAERMAGDDSGEAPSFEEGQP